jgi:hypothetical protein
MNTSRWAVWPGAHRAVTAAPGWALISYVEQSRIKICGMGYRPDSRAIFTAAQNGMVWLWRADGSFTESFVADTASPDRIFQTDVDPQGEYILVGVRNRASLWTWAAELQLELPS